MRQPPQRIDAKANPSFFAGRTHLLPFAANPTLVTFDAI